MDPAPHKDRLAERPRSLPLYLAAIGLSAFTLFALELYAGQVVLPVFGGAPSVWTTALCFFTAAVFIGYLYAHELVRRLGGRVGGVAHLAVAAAAVASATLAPANVEVLRSPAMPPALNMLLVLAAVAGLPTLLLSATTPLLSAWYGRGGDDPWWLYAVSNGASLAGLVAYPLLIQPLTPLSAQRSALPVVLGVLAVLLTAVVAGAWRGDARERAAERGDARGGAPTTAPTKAPSPPAPTTAPSAPAPPSRRRQAAWLLAAAVPAGLLSATTSQLATDHISTPLLWMGPMAAYLLSFVVAFSDRGRRLLPIAEKLAPSAVTLMWIPYVARADWPPTVLLPLTLASYAVVAVTIHGRIALDRPDERFLTRFYLLMSAGGLAATAFVALVAPLVFNDVYEFPLLIVAALAVLALFRAEGHATRDRGALLRASLRRTAPYAVVAVAVGIASASRPAPSGVLIAVALGLGGLVVLLGSSARSLAAWTAAALLVLPLAFAPPHLARVRTFFAVTTVGVTPDKQARVEIHGTTLHGLQFLDARRTEPTAYFVRFGPLGEAFADLAERTDGAAVGIVGLGVGTLAAYERAGDEMTFYEIDPAVIDVALNQRYFTYLADAPNPPRIVPGDGRLSLAADRTRFDLLVLDAFSSDSVPAHLLTREAMSLYRERLEPGGVMVFNVTNRHFQLSGAVASTAGSLGLSALTKSFTPTAEQHERFGAEPSRWVVVGREGDLARFKARGWTPAAAGPVLTDDYSDVLRLLR